MPATVDRATGTTHDAAVQDPFHLGRFVRAQDSSGTYRQALSELHSYIPLDTNAANLIFHLVASRYETTSTIITSNRAFSRWGDIFADDVVAAAIVDRLVHHADVIALNGDSYRLKHRRPRRAGANHQP